MTLREMESRTARRRALKYASLGKVETAMEIIAHCPNLRPKYGWKFNAALAYLMGVVDGKRAERARRKPPRPYLDKPIRFIDVLPQKKETP